MLLVVGGWFYSAARPHEEKQVWEKWSLQVLRCLQDRCWMDTTTLTVLLTCCGHNKLASVVPIREPVPVRRKEFVGKSTFLTQLFPQSCWTPSRLCSSSDKNRKLRDWFPSHPDNLVSSESCWKHPPQTKRVICCWNESWADENWDLCWIWNDIFRETEKLWMSGWERSLNQISYSKSLFPTFVGHSGSWFSVLIHELFCYLQLKAASVNAAAVRWGLHKH